MPNFVWKGKTRAGALQEGVLLADSRDAALAVLRRQNIQVTTLREKGIVGKFLVDGVGCCHFHLLRYKDNQVAG